MKPEKKLYPPLQNSNWKGLRLMDVVVLRRRPSARVEQSSVPRSDTAITDNVSSSDQEDNKNSSLNFGNSLRLPLQSRSFEIRPLVHMYSMSGWWSGVDVLDRNLRMSSTGFINDGHRRISGTRFDDGHLAGLILFHGYNHRLRRPELGTGELLLQLP